MVGTEALGRLLRLAGVGSREGAETGTRRGSASPYVCRGCETEFDVQYHVCPDCGGFSVEPRSIRPDW